MGERGEFYEQVAVYPSPPKLCWALLLDVVTLRHEVLN